MTKHAPRNPEDLLIETLRMAKERLHGRRSGVISHVRLATLRFIGDRPSASMKDLADHLHVARPSATLLIDHLAAKGLVRRNADRRDRRGVILALTPAGRRTLSSGARALRAGIRALLKPLSASERRGLARILERLYAAHAKNQ